MALGADRRATGPGRIKSSAPRFDTVPRPGPAATVGSAGWPGALPAHDRPGRPRRVLHDPEPTDLPGGGDTGASLGRVPSRPRYAARAPDDRPRRPSRRAVR